jgi:hypothetical protein
MSVDVYQLILKLEGTGTLFIPDIIVFLHNTAIFEMGNQIRPVVQFSYVLFAKHIFKFEFIFVMHLVGK